MSDDEEDSGSEQAITESWFKKYRLALTFLPAILVGLLDPLMGFCFFIMLLEKCVLAMLGLPGLEFTTTATFLFGMKYELATAALFAFIIPNFIMRPIKFVLWHEYVNPEEGPVNLSITSLIDVLVAVMAYFLRGINMLLGLIIVLTVKHTLNIIRTKNSDRPEMFDAAVSFVSNIVLVLILYRFILWLIH